MKEALAVWARSNPLPAVVAVLGLLALALFGWYFRYDVTPSSDGRTVLTHDRLLGTTTWSAATYVDPRQARLVGPGAK